VLLLDTPSTTCIFNDTNKQKISFIKLGYFILYDKKDKEMDKQGTNLGGDL
jgi:hypothetical protein